MKSHVQREMEYGLTRLVLECQHFLPISREEFFQVEAARRRSFKVLEIEEKLDMVLQNFVEYEHELLQITLRSALFRLGGWSEFQDIIHQIIRRVVNLLSTARLYLDQLRHDALPILEPTTGEKDAVGMITSAEYDARVGYRVMEALRNYMQHRGLPLHSISLSGGWVNTEEGRRRKEKATLYLNVDVLAEDDKFKRQVLAELKEGDRKLQLKPLVRDYITGLRRVQQQIRSKLANVVAKDDALLLSIIDRYQQEVEQETIGLAAVERHPDGTYGQTVYVSSNAIDRRRVFERKNHSAGELTTLIVTSE